MSDEEPETVEIKRYLAYDEGCYECDEPAGVLGFYGSEVEAEAACFRGRERQERAWQGQHVMFVIDLANPVMSEHADPPD
jgi:hypothetical protein